MMRSAKWAPGHLLLDVPEIHQLLELPLKLGAVGDTLADTLRAWNTFFMPAARQRLRGHFLGWRIDGHQHEGLPPKALCWPGPPAAGSWAPNGGTQQHVRGVALVHRAEGRKSARSPAPSPCRRKFHRRGSHQTATSSSSAATAAVFSVPLHLLR